MHRVCKNCILNLNGYLLSKRVFKNISCIINRSWYVYLILILQTKFDWFILLLSSAFLKPRLTSPSPLPLPPPPPTPLFPHPPLPPPPLPPTPLFPPPPSPPPYLIFGLIKTLFLFERGNPPPKKIISMISFSQCNYAARESPLNFCWVPRCINIIFFYKIESLKFQGCMMHQHTSAQSKNLQNISRINF